MTTVFWAIAVVLTLLRAAGSYVLPFTGDEAYYWEWSRHLAAGYIDHPAGVAWTIAAFHWAGNSPFAIRFGFWLCGVVTTCAVADCARRLAQANKADARLAAAAAAALSTLAPIIAIAFGTVSPDGPFLASWALALDSAVALSASPNIWRAIATGIAIGIGLESRAFAVALLFGVLISLRRNIVAACIVFMTSAFCTVPLLWWNATHDWSMIVFTLFGRHVDEGFSLTRPLLMLAEIILAFGIGPAIAVAWATVAGIRRRNVAPILLWTSLPLLGLLLLIACIERVETYWLLGPYLSLSIAASVVFASQQFAITRRTRLATAIPAMCTLAILYLLIFASQPIARYINDNWHARLHRAGPFSIYAIGDLARDTKRIAQQRHAVVFSDGYGLSSLLDYYAALPPILIGYSWQGRELRHLYTSVPTGQDGLFIDMALLHDRPDFIKQLHIACGKTLPGPVFRYRKGDLPDMIFPTTWCLSMKPEAISILRWEHVQ